MSDEIPLEIIVKIALEGTVFVAKGDVLSFSPDSNDSKFKNFLTGVNKRRLRLFASGADEVFYNNTQIGFKKTEDRAYFEQEFNLPIRELVYHKM